MNEITAHRIQEIRILIDNVLIVEKEFIGFQQLLLFYHQLISILIIFHDLIVFHVVVRDRLASKHYERIFINHVQAYKPDPPVHNSMKDYPRISLDV